MVGLVGGPGEEPPDAGEFSKICKIFLIKNAKMENFHLFYKDTSKPCVRPSRVGRKTQLVGEILQKF